MAYYIAGAVALAVLAVVIYFATKKTPDPQSPIPTTKDKEGKG